MEIPKLGKNLNISFSKRDLIPSIRPTIEKQVARNTAAPERIPACPPALYVSTIATIIVTTEITPRIEDMIPLSGCLLSVNIYLFHRNLGLIFILGLLNLWLKKSILITHTLKHYFRTVL
jgi:hypothetical protein